jgi:hypothetical protein
MGALHLGTPEIEKLNSGRKDSRVLWLLREESAVVNLVPQTRHPPGGLEVLKGLF